MAHFAKLDENNIVTQVIVVSNDIATSESAGITFINNLYGTSDTWKQTSYNKNIRKNYAGIGYSYDVDRDAFIPPKLHASWTLDEDTCQWEPPVAYPDDYDTVLYSWNEETQSWDAVE